MRAEVVCAAEQTIARVARAITLHVRCGEENWLDWHNKRWHVAKESVEKALGASPATVILACAAAGVGRLLRRAADTALGGVIRRRSAKDVAAIKVMARKSLGRGGARRSATHAFGGSNAWGTLAGACWWDTLALKPRRVADQIVASHEPGSHARRLQRVTPVASVLPAHLSGTLPRNMA